MKKKLVAFLLVITLLALMVTPAFAADIRTVWTDITYRGISIVVNGIKIVPCDEQGNPTEPFIMNDTTYLPVRAIAGALGLSVGWEPATSTIVLGSGGEANYGSGTARASFDVKQVSITYRGTNISLDGKNIPLVNRNGESVEPFIYNGTNYLPLRIVSEALGLNVAWDGASSTVTMKEKTDGDTPAPPVYDTYVWEPQTIVYSGGETGKTMSQLLTMSYSYDGEGRLTGVSSSDGSIDMSCVYNGFDQLTDAKFKVNGSTTSYRWDYDEDGNVEAYFVNGKIQEGYYCVSDSEGRITKELIAEDGSYKSYEYDYNELGQVKEMRDLSTADVVRYEYVYDEQGKLICEYEYSPGNKYITTYEYSEDGLSYHSKRCTESGAVHRETDVSFDEEGRILSKAEFMPDYALAMSRDEYEYDSEGRVVVHRRGSDKAENHWQKGEVTIKFGDMEETTTSYNANGEVAQEITKYYLGRVDYYGEAEYTHRSTNEYKATFDAKGRLTKEYWRYTSEVESYKSYRENYWVYDSQDRLVGYQYSPDGSVVETWSCQYNDNGKITWESYKKMSVGTVLESYELSSQYDAKGNPTTSTYTDHTGLKLTEKYTYNSKGQPVTITTDQNGNKVVSNIKYNGDGLPTRTETRYYNPAVTVVSEVSYVKVPGTEESAQLTFLLGLLEVTVSNLTF